MNDQSTFSLRTLASASQLLGSIAKDSANTVLQKAGVASLSIFGQVEVLEALVASALDVQAQLIDEFVLRGRSLRFDAPTKYVFDDRLSELMRCLALDGLEFSNGVLARVDPSSIELVQIRDALDIDLAVSEIDADGSVRRCLDLSARAFTDTPADMNASTTQIRIALETVVRRTAARVASESNEPAPADKWGSALAYLKNSSVITQLDEHALSSSYTATSPGAHVPKSLSDLEWARMVRAINLAWIFYVLRCGTQ